MKRQLFDAVRGWPAGTLFVLTDSTDWEICAFRSTPFREVPDLIAAKMAADYTTEIIRERVHTDHTGGDSLICYLALNCLGDNDL